MFFQSLPSEIEVKYKIAECYTILKLDKDAIAVLDGIPSRQRTPKVGRLGSHVTHQHSELWCSSGRDGSAATVWGCSRSHGILCVVQINMMLANLYRKAGQERSAVTSYKEVLRQCPLALDAIIGRRGQAVVARTPCCRAA